MVSLKEISIKYGISHSQLRLLCRLGVIPAKKVGRDWIVELSPIELEKVLLNRPKQGWFGKSQKKLNNA